MLILLFLLAICLAGLTPIAGKVARLQTVISATTVAHEFEDWTLSLKSEMIECNGFEKTADSDGNYWNSYLVGLSSGEASFGGAWNSAKLPTTSFRPGSAYTYTSLFCGISTSVGFTLTGKCSAIEASTNVKQKGMFKGTFQIEGVTTYPS
mgnify:CR=1 FL=1